METWSYLLIFVISFQHWLGLKSIVDRYFFAQFTASEQHQCFWEVRHGKFQGSMA